MPKSGAKRKVSGKRKKPVMFSTLDEFDQEEFEAGIGHHYDSKKEGGRRKKQAKDLFDDSEINSSGAAGWGMMMGGIEVVDASKYLVVNARKGEGKGKGKGKKEEENDTVNDDDDDDDDNEDNNDRDPFSDCDLSDEEGDIMILEPGEKKPSAVEHSVAGDEKSAAVADWDGELERSEWDDSEEDEKPEKKTSADTKKSELVAARSVDDRGDDEKPKKKTANDFPPPVLTPFMKKTKTLSAVANLLQYHKPTSSLMTNWQITCSGITLPYLVAHNFVKLGYESPMAIQAATLPSALLGHRDIVGAAPTGSGKTLCYGLSVVMGCLKELEDEVEGEGGMKALILVPTRELAMQVTKEISSYCKVPDEKLLGELRGDSKKKKKKGRKNKPPKLIMTEGIIRVGTIVGGLSKEKQERVLKNRPEIIVATPGRLWELMSSQEHPHLNDFSCLKFLVIDEADRMVKQGNFPQLEKIFEDINDGDDDDEEEEEEEEEEESSEEDDVEGEEEVENNSEDDEDGEDGEDGNDDDEEEMTEAEIQEFLGFIPEATTKMLSDEILASNEKIKRSSTPGDILKASSNAHSSKSAKPTSANSKGKLDKSIRQTFIYSATLTLPKPEKKDKNDNKKKGRKSREDENILQTIMEKAGSKGVIKVVDLSVDGDDAKSIKPVKQTTTLKQKTVKLPPGLSLYQARCTQLHKDSYTYAFLSTTAQGTKGPSIVFCNSIGGVKRVARTLEELGMNVRSLHADMPQKQRFKALEALRKPNSRCVLVATDVAARGIDIPEVASVIHYDLPRSGGVDTFVHRSGRTARGVGTIGTSLSLIGPKEEKAHMQICKAVNGIDDNSKAIELSAAPLDAHLLAAAQERANLAEKIVKCDEAEQKKAASNNWFAKAAEDAGLDLEDSLMEELEGKGDGKKGHQKFREAEQARAKLRKLLKKPMRKQQFGKFLTGSVGLKRSLELAGGVVGGLGVGGRGVEEDVQTNKFGKKKRRKRSTR